MLLFALVIVLAGLVSADINTGLVGYWNIYHRVNNSQAWVIIADINNHTIPVAGIISLPSLTAMYHSSQPRDLTPRKLSANRLNIIPH